MFRAIIPPILRSTRLCVTACGIMHTRCCRPATSWAHYTTSCNTQSSVPEDGRNSRPNHVELIGIINKLLLLHLVGCLYYLYQWLSKHQIYISLVRICVYRSRWTLPQDSSLMSNIYTNDVPTAPGILVTIFVMVRASTRRRIMGNVQRDPTAVHSWYSRWNLKSTVRESQANSFSRRLKNAWGQIQLKKWNISFVDNVKYLDVFFDSG